MNIEDLFTGVAVIIDDEVKKEEANISNILRQIRSKNIPYIAYDTIPDKNIVSHFAGVSFVLLDWKLDNEEIIDEGLGGLKIPSTLKEYNISENIDFLKSLKEKTFTPVFIFTNEEKDTVISELQEHKLYQEDKPNFIFIKNKDELAKELFSEVEKWIISNPPVYVLLQWNKGYQLAKNRLFWDFYERSPLWPKILWDCYKADGANMSRELGEIITRNLYTRIPPISFEESFLEACASVEPDSGEVRNVLEGERFIKGQYLNSKDIYTGDVYKQEIEEENTKKIVYWLNIRAQCDLVRNRNPDLYCLKGRQISDDEIKNIPFENGEFIEKKNHVIVTCIDDGKIIEFLFRELKIHKWNSIKNNRIGRLLPPYITRIQQLYSVYFQRQGLPRNPDEAFPSVTKSLGNIERLAE